MAPQKGDVLEVWLDVDFIDAPCLAGHLHHDRGQVRFHYEPAWLTNPLRFEIDPDLSLDAGPFFPNPQLGNFGIFLDSSPDRWGQTLMQRREALAARDEERKARAIRRFASNASTEWMASAFFSPPP